MSLWTDPLRQKILVHLFLDPEEVRNRIKTLNLLNWHAAQKAKKAAASAAKQVHQASTAK